MNVYENLLLVLLAASIAVFVIYCLLLFTADWTETKDAEYVAAQQKELALEAAGGDPAKVNCVLMDNPAVNRKALRMLEDEFPT